MTSSSSSAPVVTTTAGALQGAVVGRVDAFLGIPFAAPPTGGRRWLPPQPVAPWSGVRDATRPGPSCLQAAPSPGRQLLDMTEHTTDEDCLYLNVWTPACDDRRRPVLVWLHGGAFVIGSGALAFYDGSALAARGDVVVVTVNYRLGLFGWLRSEALGTSGNEGLEDQRAALDWVTREIAAFGGDPDEVTLFGESAGAISIAAHLASGPAAGPAGHPGGRRFRRAVLQSGAHHLLLGRSAADRTCTRVLDDLGGPTADDLRSLGAGELLAVQDRATPRAAGIFYGALRDGALVATGPLAALRGGVAAGIDLLIGSNRDEMGFFWGRDPGFDQVEPARLRSIARQWSPDEAGADALIDAYRRARTARGEPTDDRALAVAIGTDATFRRGALELADAQIDHATVHTYLFDWPSPLHDGRVGAAHLLETPFVFGTHHDPTVADFAGAERPGADELSAAMMDAWIAFARHGDPGWAAHDRQRRPTMVFGARSALAEDPLGQERRAWGLIGDGDPRRGG